MSAPPSDRRVGARIRIKPEHADAVAERFAAATFHPIYIEHRTDGTVSFWFDKPTAKSPDFIEVVRALPIEWWGLIGIVGGPPFD